MIILNDHMVRCFLHNLVILSIHSYDHYAIRNQDPEKKSKLNFESSKIEVKKVFRILLSIAFHCTRFFFLLARDF